MRKKITVTNYKAFSDKTEIEIAPLNLIFGPNSSGKTSILHLFLLLKQTLNNKEGEILKLKDESALDLGSFKDIIFQNNRAKTLTIKINTQLEHGRDRRFTPHRGVVDEFVKIAQKFNASLEIDILEAAGWGMVLNKVRVFSNEKKIYEIYLKDLKKNIYVYSKNGVTKDKKIWSDLIEKFKQNKEYLIGRHEENKKLKKDQHFIGKLNNFLISQALSNNISTKYLWTAKLNLKDAIKIIEKNKKFFKKNMIDMLFKYFLPNIKWQSARYINVRKKNEEYNEKDVTLFYPYPLNKFFESSRYKKFINLIYNEKKIYFLKNFAIKTSDRERETGEKVNVNLKSYTNLIGLKKVAISLPEKEIDDSPGEYDLGSTFDFMIGRTNIDPYLARRLYGNKKIINNISKIDKKELKKVKLNIQKFIINKTIGPTLFSGPNLTKKELFNLELNYEKLIEILKKKNPDLKLINFLADDIEKNTKYRLINNSSSGYMNLDADLLTTESLLYYILVRPRAFFKSDIREFRRTRLIYTIEEFVHGITWDNKSFFDSIFYLSSFRVKPNRTEIFTGARTDDVGFWGQNMANTLFSSTLSKKGLKKIDKLNKKLKEQDILHEVRIVKAENLPGVYEIRVWDIKTKALVNWLDIGHGIFRYLPFLFETVLSKNKLLISEESESNFHPRLMGKFAPMVVDSIKENKNKFIFETHSEHFILALQKLIREGKLSNTDLNVYYCHKIKKGSSKLLKLEIDDKGRFITKWPDGFFTERMKLL